MRAAREMVLREDERAERSTPTASRLTSVRLSQRARIVLLTVDGSRTGGLRSNWTLGGFKWRAGVGAMPRCGVPASTARRPGQAPASGLRQLRHALAPGGAGRWARHPRLNAGSGPSSATRYGVRFVTRRSAATSVGLRMPPAWILVTPTPTRRLEIRPAPAWSHCPISILPPGSRHACPSRSGRNQIPAPAR